MEIFEVTISRVKSVSRARVGVSPVAWIVSAFLALALVLAAAAAQAKAPPDGFADLAEKLLPAVVNISTTQTIQGRTGPEAPQLPPGFEEFFKEFFDRNQPKQRKRKATSLGSGFIIDASGYVVTNNHVIQDAEEITVILQDDTRLDAELVGRDPKTDLAVLRVKPEKDLPAVSFGDSDKMRVGDWVVAIGNPFGLGGTVTAGIISARGRDINNGPYDDFLQTDASINRGNSGGPMFDLDGGVVGINTAIYSPSGGSIGIGFAIPSAIAKSVVRQLIETGTVRRGWLGVHIQTVTDEIAETLGLEEGKGALVASVIKGGPAEEAKIEAGDVILDFNGREVSQMRRLPRIVADTGVGKTVDVTLWRNNEKLNVRVTVGELEPSEKEMAAVTDGPKIEEGGSEKAIDALGMTLSVVTDALRQKFELGEETKGLVVTAIAEGGPASEKGISPGDVVVEVSQEDVTGPDQVDELVGSADKAGRKSVLLLIDGQGRLRFVAVRIAKS
ncbi:MAG: DegQ family serine endoprotease [Rhodospirillales bacterium]|jgi:serine protease Do|nr:DegQ family serine endoprotease [Rhodospirillales bacterium]